MLLSALVLALAIGLLLGLLGGGGSILTVPALVYLFGYGAKSAIAMSLPVVGVASLVGTSLHWRLGNVQLRTAGLFGLFTMMGGFAGARLAQLVSGRVQLMLLGVIMLISAFSLLRGKPQPEESGSANVRTPRFALLIPLALGVGVLTALVGIGGGFLIVPALVLLGRLSMRQAVGTSLLVISMNATAGFVGYLGSVTIRNSRRRVT